MDRLRRHRLDVSMLPLADWRIVRLRTRRINGSSRRDSNLLAHERGCTSCCAHEARPLVFLLRLLCSAFRAMSLAAATTGKETDLAAERR